ncbi:E3 ubiquitin-protein ligase DA2L-like [Hevea brasiliensis]|uniref:E3 ubiquitin-protein ligase DA2L-like n=1 Tax=Hevea brasiliensis TaxID=3981 RepID=UPI0025E5B348|nr:E3 ubiquitin-protein ligase DA2L-like [Hevea brasiliensis]XP_057992440.1 E3 ubiquitin-protein ligase DA2L-like [Hevea brasiliensis]XP_057992441.1 E3 ubiquitin-protein ligase DA2L-like [Hevea brasiliensis]XP_057992442.1 E3 ubiquitin-protein ligase DA2L-like [Hevea brasiliensis]
MRRILLALEGILPLENLCDQENDNNVNGLSQSIRVWNSRNGNSNRMSVQPFRSPVESKEIIRSQYSIKHPPHHSPDRVESEFDLDLEDIMVMEAIWLSIQAHRQELIVHRPHRPRFPW